VNAFTLLGSETAIPGNVLILAFRSQLIAAGAYVRYC
jgi:hypothetical protein